MNYDFTLDKKSVVSLVAGSIVLALLLFGAGWIVGMSWPASGTGPAGTATGKPGTSQQTARDSLPSEPVIRTDAQPPNVSVPGNSGIAKPELSHPGQLASASQPGLAGAPAQPQTSKSSPAVIADSAAAQQQDQGVVEPPAANASAARETAGTGQTIFTIQIGAFLEQNEASRLLQEMERKGYSPSFFSDRDGTNRQWFAVRIGAYSDKDQAANAAANFTRQEKIKAVVRPLGAL